jgi:hypothetical protein
MPLLEVHFEVIRVEPGYEGGGSHIVETGMRKINFDKIPDYLEQHKNKQIRKSSSPFNFTLLGIQVQFTIEGEKNGYDFTDAILKKYDSDYKSQLACSTCYYLTFTYFHLKG